MHNVALTANTYLTTNMSVLRGVFERSRGRKLRYEWQILYDMVIQESYVWSFTLLIKQWSHCIVKCPEKKESSLSAVEGKKNE